MTKQQLIDELRSYGFTPEEIDHIIKVYEAEGRSFEEDYEKNTAY